jgi:uncharacterized membrane protein
MSKERMEAFSDGVIAIIITVMVLELRIPQGASPAALRPLYPIFLSYVLSFINLGIYWTNHHHLLQAIERVNGGVLWANLHLLFWLSLFPFATAWMGENNFSTWPVALYGLDLLLAACAYYLLVRVLLSLHGVDSTLAAALGSDFKGRISIVFYVIAVPVAFVNSWIACAIYVLVAAMWLIPDQRIEKRLA